MCIMSGASYSVSVKLTIKNGSNFFKKIMCCEILRTVAHCANVFGCIES